MYHRYNTDAPDFEERYEVWWDTLIRWFPTYFQMPYEQKRKAIETMNVLLGAL